MKHRLILTTAELRALHQWLREAIAVHPSKWRFANLEDHLIWWTLNDLEVRLYHRVRMAVPVTKAARPYRIALSPQQAIALLGRLQTSGNTEGIDGNHWITELYNFIDQIRTG
jgi:hypothetical protein